MPSIVALFHLSLPFCSDLVARVAHRNFMFQHIVFILTGIMQFIIPDIPVEVSEHVFNIGPSFCWLNGHYIISILLLADNFHKSFFVWRLSLSVRLAR